MSNVSAIRLVRPVLARRLARRPYQANRPRHTGITHALGVSTIRRKLTAEQLIEAYDNGERDYKNIVIIGDKNLCGANLQAADFHLADFENCRLLNVNLRDVNFEEGNLRRACLRLADFSGANLKKANLFYASLFQAKLENTDLRDTELEGADLRGAYLAGARICGVDITNARISRDSLLTLTTDKWKGLSIDERIKLWTDQDGIIMEEDE